MSRVSFLADPSEGKEILRVLESSASKGALEIIYTRRPDAYESFMKEYGENRVLVSRDGERVTGCCAELIREVYVSGKECRAAYICALKRDAEYCGGMVFSPRFIASLADADADLFYCSVISDNHETRDIFAKSSRLFRIREIVEYRTFILTPQFKFGSEKKGLTFAQAREADREELLAFFAKEGRKKDLFPVIRTLDGMRGLKIEDFYILRNGSGIAAAGALWDQTEYKQYAVKKYRGLMRLARFFNPFLSLFGFIKLPHEDEVLSFPMISFLLARDDDPHFCKAFLGALMPEIKKRGYGSFAIGAPKNSVIARILGRVPGVNFDTQICTVGFAHKDSAEPEVDPSTAYPECAFL